MSTGRWVAAAILLALTFAYPKAAFVAEQFRALIVLDITQSMNTLDATRGGKPVSRLEFGKWSISRALLDLPCGSEIGLGIFTEYRSFLLLAPVEVCANYQELARTLAAINGQIAWAGGSEVIKAINAALTLAKGLDSALVFVTDGHEAPPLHPQHWPRIGEDAVPGLILGVGALNLSPIPKFAPDGKPLGFWSADEVLQTDTYSLGRGGTGEGMVDADGKPVVVQKRSGTEHLSALKEAHLIRVAQQTGLSYERLDSSLVGAIENAKLGRTAPVNLDLRWIFAGAALVFALPLGSPGSRRFRRTSDT